MSMRRRTGISFSVSTTETLTVSPPPSPTLCSFSPIPPVPVSCTGPTPFERILEIILDYLCIILKPLIWLIYFKAVAETYKHWNNTTKVNLKLDELTQTLKQHGIGPGSVILYSAEGNNWKGLLRYMIKGRTNSRYSHVMMLIPHPEDKNKFAVWQSALPHPMKLGGGETLCGADVSDITQAISVFSKKYAKSRFVFRPLKSSLSPLQQERIQDCVQKVMDKNTYYPMNLKLYWSWTLSNNPRLASWAHSLGLDCGVVEDKYDFAFCSMLVTQTLTEIGVLDPTTKAPQYSPADYGLPQNKVPVFGDEIEFVFDDLQW